MDQERATSSYKSRANELLVGVFLFGFVLSILISSFVHISPMASLFFILLFISVVVGEKLYAGKVSKEVCVLGLLILSFGLGSLRYSVKDFHIDRVPSFDGVVVSEPEHKDNSTRFVLGSTNGEKSLVSTDLYSDVAYGDLVVVEGKFKKPDIIEGDDGRDFDYRAYLAKDDIYHTMSFAKVEVLEHNKASTLKLYLYKLKGRFVRETKKILPEPESSLLSGLIVAGKDALPAGVLEDFRRAGVVHIVVLSGYNITIIADAIRAVFGSALASTLGIVFFVLMTGAEPTVVRASLMVLVVILAKKMHRKFSAPRALVLVAFLMLLENPKLLVYDPSFQLSFLATLALIYIAPLAEKLFVRVPAKWGLRSALSTTVSTQIFVLPYLVYSMGDLSLVSLPANLLVLMIIPLTMLVGFVATVLSMILPLVYIPLSYMAHLLLAYILYISELFGRMKFASVAIESFGFYWVILFYLLIFIGLKLLRSFLQHSSN